MKEHSEVREMRPPQLWSPGEQLRERGSPLVPKSFTHLTMLPPEPDWLWEGFLAPGFLTMLAGHPFAGKSVLVSGLLQALEGGERFLDRKTKQASALLVSEESEPSLHERAARFDLFGIRSEYLDRSVTVGCGWSSLIAGATKHALASDHRLLVVDTFPGLAGLGDEQENDAGAITSRLQPLQAAAGAGLAVLFLHHMNNANQPRGSKAFRGVVDVATRLLRTSRSRRFRLETETRSTTTLAPTVHAELIQAPDGWFYHALDRGSRGGNRGSGATTDELLWEALRLAGSTGVTYDELDRRDGLSRDIAKRRLPGWWSKDRVGRHGTGAKNDPYRWYPCPSG